MDTPPPGIVSVPGIDAPHYFYNFIGYFTNHAGDFLAGGKSFLGVVIAICIPICVFLLIAIVFVVERLKRIRNLEEEKIGPKSEPALVEEKVDKELESRWRKVMEHTDSENPNDWKQAIIEADVMLDTLVTKLGYRGESLGEKLKRTVKGDFKTRDQAWDAHMVRNRIAHDGSDFELNQIEARRVIGLYRQVFEEFYHIGG